MLVTNQVRSHPSQLSSQVLLSAGTRQTFASPKVIQETYFPGQPRRVFSQGFRSAFNNTVQHEGVSLSYSVLDGHLLNVGASNGDSILISIVLDGEATVWTNGEKRDLSAGSGVVIVGGDHVVQSLEDTQTFILRIPSTSRLNLQIQATPHMVRDKLPRSMTKVEAAEFGRVFMFAANEIDLRGGLDDFGRLLLGTLERYATHLFAQYIPPADERPPETMLDICRNVRVFLSGRGPKRTSLHELAQAGCCSLRQLHRAFEAVTRSTPADFARRCQLNYLRSEIANRSAEQLDCHEPTISRALRQAYADEFGEVLEETVRRQGRLVKSILSKHV
ncbi:MAG TPA: hypothetical protein PKA27_14565 [Fimbriimonadaceae bacterium]|nr:hypothetical protein [Fimbriimonadaceae bacterium]